jgi:hypothetical protein
MSNDKYLYSRTPCRAQPPNRSCNCIQQPSRGCIVALWQVKVIHVTVTVIRVSAVILQNYYTRPSHHME